MAIELRPPDSDSWIALEPSRGGVPATVWYRDRLIYLPEEIIDDMGYSDFSDFYYEDDPGQLYNPTVVSGDGVDGTDGLQWPTNSPNMIISAPSGNPAHDSSEQPNQLPNYPESSKAVEFYFRPDEMPTSGQLRVLCPVDDLAQSPSVRFRLHGADGGYARIEDNTGSSWDYLGDDPQEEYFSWGSGHHRFIMDFVQWPEVQFHGWDGSGSHLFSMETSGGDATSLTFPAAFGFWWNDTTAGTLSRIRNIERQDYYQDLP